MEVDYNKEQSHNLRIKLKVQCDELFNPKLFHDVQRFTKVRRVLLEMVHVNPLNRYIDIFLGLDHIFINESPLLGQEQFTSLEMNPIDDIGVALPANQKLSLRHSIPIDSVLLVLVSGPLEVALRSLGSLGCIWIAKALATRIPRRVRAPGATTYDMQRKQKKTTKEAKAKTKANQKTPKK